MNYDVMREFASYLWPCFIVLPFSIGERLINIRQIEHITFYESEDAICIHMVSGEVIDAPKECYERICDAIKDVGNIYNLA